MNAPLRIATRGSTLALAQAGWVAAQISALTGRETELVRVTTHGDTSTASLGELGGTGAFATAVRDAVLANDCDVAVHSLKDLPTAPLDGLVVAAIPRREDARDVLCARDGTTLAGLAAGARIGTGSPRRRAQVLLRRPDVTVVDVRGNVDTRLARIHSDLDAVVLALAGLRRIGREGEVSETFDIDGWPTAAGQGALAVEIRVGDDATRGAVEALDDGPSRACVSVERAVLAGLEAGCSAPVGVAASLLDGTLDVVAAVYAAHGEREVRVRRTVRVRAGDLAILEAVQQFAAEMVEELFAKGARDLGSLGGRR